MFDNLKTIQECINKKASYRLNVELGIISKFFEDNRLVSITDNPGLPDICLEGGKAQKPRWFFQYRGDFISKLREYWLPIYQAEESKKFIDEVNNLKNSVENLLSTQPEEY